MLDSHLPKQDQAEIMSSELRTLRNFINGDFTDTVDGATSEVINPRPDGRTPPRPSPAQPIWIRPSRPLRPLSRSGSQHLSERQRHCSRSRTRADEFVAVESENTGKPMGLTSAEELPPAVDQLRFFAGAARILEGRSAGEYMAGQTSFIRREPVGILGQVTPWNYP